MVKITYRHWEVDDPMPNHVRNQITFGTGDDARAAFQQMLREVRAEGQPLGSIDFNKLIPMPSELNIEAGPRTRDGLKLFGDYLCEAAQIAVDMPGATPVERAAAMFRHMDSWQKTHEPDPEVWELGKKAYRNIQKYGCATWLEWCRSNWGTKWNAYQCAPLDERAGTMEFQTANCAVPKIAEALSKRFPVETVTYRWSGLDLTQDLGRMVFQDGKAVNISIPEDELALACAMSAGVWRFGAKEEQAADGGQRGKKAGHRKEPER